MPRVTTLKPRAGSQEARLRTSTTKDKRVTGRTLQRIRLDMWKADPHCEMCGCITQYPYGFEIDHKVPLFEGGSESAENRQLLCNQMGNDCHGKKTATEKGRMK